MWHLTAAMELLLSPCIVTFKPSSYIEEQCGFVQTCLVSLVACVNPCMLKDIHWLSSVACPAIYNLKIFGKNVNPAFITV